MKAEVEPPNVAPKRRGSCLKIILLAVVGAVFFAWYLGFVSIASGPARAGIRHALNLKFLPLSLRVNSSGTESWTDYIFEADFQIDPQSLDSLLAGRSFVLEETSFYQGRKTTAQRINSYQGFPISEMWSCHYPAERQGDQGTTCTFYTNRQRDRVFISYMTD